MADDVESAAALIRPFSRLSLPFFRKKPSPPSNDPLAALRAASLHVESGESVDFDTAVKALVGLRDFVSRFKADATTSGLSVPRAELILEAYLRGFYIASRAACEGPWNGEMAQASKDCIQGYLMANAQAREETKELGRPHLLGAMFPPISDESHLLTPLFDRPRRLTDEIQHHHIQRPGGKKALRDAAESAPVDPVKDRQQEAVYHLEIFSLLAGYLTSMGSLPLSTSPDQSAKISKVRLKALENEASCRPLRIALESRLLRCELATALASVDVVNIKARAKGRSRSPTPELLSDDDNSSSAESDEEDVKPDVKPRVVPSPAPARRSLEEKDDNEEGVCWEEEAEDYLYDCLDYTHQLLDDRHSAVLIDAPLRTDWLGTADTPQALRPSTRRTSSESEESSNSGLDSESGSDQDPSSSEVRATPLRALFRLQDRYEELRLAVWLSLPPDSRGRMSAYMRGAPTPTQILRIKGPGMGGAKFKELINGRIGEAWDRLGIALLKKFDR